MRPLTTGLDRSVEEHVAIVVPGLGGEPDDDLAGSGRIGHQPGQNIRVGGELDGHRGSAPVIRHRGCLLLDLGGRHGERPVVGDGRCHDNGVGIAGDFTHGMEHVGGGAGGDDGDTRW